MTKQGSPTATSDPETNETDENPGETDEESSLFVIFSPTRGWHPNGVMCLMCTEEATNTRVPEGYPAVPMEGDQLCDRCRAEEARLERGRG